MATAGTAITAKTEPSRTAREVQQIFAVANVRPVSVTFWSLWNSYIGATLVPSKKYLRNDSYLLSIGFRVRAA
jgi:hypothetical protein